MHFFRFVFSDLGDVSYQDFCWNIRVILLTIFQWLMLPCSTVSEHVWFLNQTVTVAEPWETTEQDIKSLCHTISGYNTTV